MIIILVLGSAGIGSFVSRLVDVRIIYLWLPERKVSLSEWMLFGTYDSQLLRSTQGQNFITVSERCFRKSLAHIQERDCKIFSGKWSTWHCHSKGREIAPCISLFLFWEAECFRFNAFSIFKLPALPESIRAYVAHTYVQLCIESQKVELSCVSNIGILDELIATEIFPDSSLLVWESY